MLLGRNLRQQARRYEIPIARAGIPTPGKMGAPVGGIIDPDDDLTGQQALDPEVPLVDVGIPVRRCSQIVAIPVAPLRQVAVLFSLRTR